jgi:1-acyl-sn-glycerol-3-phosphate acyltransferase
MTFFNELCFSLYVGILTLNFAFVNFIFSVISNHLHNFTFFYSIRFYNFLLNNKISVKGDINVLDGKPLIFVANHYDGLDFSVLYEVLNNHCGKGLKTIAKSDLIVPHSLGIISNIINNIFLKAYNLIPYYRGNKESGKEVLKCVYKNINKNINLLVFPEGETREGGEIKNFRNGIFIFAEENNIPIVPITIYYSTFRGSNRDTPSELWHWYGNKVYVTIHPKINPGLFEDMKTQAFDIIKEQIKMNDSIKVI